jgi:hypothetical protein
MFASPDWGIALKLHELGYGNKFLLKIATNNLPSQGPVQQKYKYIFFNKKHQPDINKANNSFMCVESHTKQQQTLI